MTFRLALFVFLALTAPAACGLFDDAPAQSPAEIAPEARRALEQACKADAAAIVAGLKKPTPEVTEACEIVRRVCAE